LLPVTITMREEVALALRVEAAKQGKSRSWLLNKIAEKYLEEIKERSDERKVAD